MVKNLNIIAIVQARLSSKRFSSKVLKKIGGLTMVELVYKRLKVSKYLHDIVYAIPKNQLNKELEIFLKKKRLNILRVVKKMLSIDILVQLKNLEPVSLLELLQIVH